MKKRTRTLLERVAALIAFLAVAACDSDTAKPSVPDALTAEEVVALVEGLAEVGRLTGDTATATPTPNGSTAECPLGGTIAISGTITADSAESNQILRSDLVVTPQSCRFTARGATFTATGAPNFRQVGDVTITGLFEQVELDYDITGAVDWETGSPARRGKCSLDLDLTGEVDVPGIDATDSVTVVRSTLAGTACEEAVNLPLVDTIHSN